MTRGGHSRSRRDQPTRASSAAMPGKDDLLPLDVHYDRMIEWMVDRSTLPTKWSEGVSRCRELLEPLLADLPPRAEIKALLRDPSEMSYFDCRRIFEVLLEEAKQAGDAGKTLFGSYANARLKAWDALLSAFRKKNVFLGDAARLLVQRTDHEIPAIKASCAQHSQQIQELTRKATETTRNAGETERKLAAACAKVGIDGVSYRSELAALVSELPALLVRVDSATRNEHVVAGAQYYRAFTAFIREAPVVGRAAGGGRAGGKAGKGTSGAAAALASEEPTAPDALLPSLQRYMELDVVRSDVADSADGAGGDSGAAGAAKGESGGEVEIDWGIDVSGGDNGAGDSGGGGGGVDWGIEASGGDTGDAPAGTAATAKEVEINWDLSVDGGRDAGGSRGEIEIDWGGGDDAGGGIDWGGGGGDDAGAAAGAGGGEGGGDACEAIEATDTTASAILQDSSLRVKLVDDLMELEGFLAQRLTEMRDEADLTFADQFASANGE